jgi:hypothetical protein
VTNVFIADKISEIFPDNVFKSFLDQEFDFYGVSGHCFCIGRNGIKLVLKVIEHADGSGRSFFGCFKVEQDEKNVFKRPIAKIKIIEGGLSDKSHNNYSESELLINRRRQLNFSGWIFVDIATKHTWLTVGTDHGDDYYPQLTFRYDPDKSIVF